MMQGSLWRGSTGETVQKTATFIPDLFTKDEVKGFRCRFASRDGSTYIANVASDGNALLVMGFVRSDSRHDLYHYVVAPLDLGSMRDLAGGGHCKCESTHYHGKPCKHVLKLRNVYWRNRGRLEHEFALPELRTHAHAEE